MISCDNLSIGYGSVVVQDHITFSINNGDYVCIVGENGAGKSTLIKTLLGIIPAVAGQFVVDEAVRHEGIGYLPQQDVAQHIFPTIVGEVVLSGLQSKSGLFYSRKDRAVADDKMKRMDVYDIRSKSYAELSGGQQQRVLLARALCASEKLLVLDEPITGLDMNSQRQFYDLVRQLNHDGTTVIMISHDSSVFTGDATHILEVGHDSVRLYTMDGYRKKTYYG